MGTCSKIGVDRSFLIYLFIYLFIYLYMYVFIYFILSYVNLPELGLTGKSYHDFPGPPSFQGTPCFVCVFVEGILVLRRDSGVLRP